jgi:ribosomal protein L33
MSKYDGAKFLKETRARVVHICDKCGKQIKCGEIYYLESIGRINTPGIRLKKFCKDCFQKYGNKLLQNNF